MNRYVVQQKKRVGRDGLLLTLRQADGYNQMEYLPGQYVSVGFKRFGRRTPMRSFSIVSSPTDRDILEVAMRVQGDFTRAFSAVAAGDEVFVQGPFGSFIVDTDFDQDVLLLAGGIGITPFMSMLRFATETQQDVHYTLLYSCRSQIDIAFMDELLELEQRNPNLQVLFFVTDGDIRPYPGAKIYPGRINEERLQRITEDRFNGKTYFLCGPNAFTNGLEETLLRNGVRPDRVVNEAFAQSSKLFSARGRSLRTGTYMFASVVALLAIVGIMALDLIRSVPKLANTQTARSTSTNNIPTTTTASTGTDTSSASNTSTQTTTATQPSTQSTQTYYAPPVSGVS